MKEETKKLLQLLAEQTGISNQQVKRDYDIVYFLTEDTKIKERKTIAKMHNYYVSLNVENDMPDGLNIEKNITEELLEESTKKILQLLAERTGITKKQIKRDFDIVYFMLKNETKNREVKTYVLLHNYYISLNIENDLSDAGVEKRLNIGKIKCERIVKELSEL